MKKKNRVLAVLLSLFVVISMMPVAMVTAFAEEQSDDIVILFSGDIHGSVDENLGLAGLEAYAKEKRITNKYVELVDCGDAVSGTTMAAISKGQYVIDAMNLVSYGAAVPGVHEFDYGVSTFISGLAGQAEHDYISCNFIQTRNNQTVFKPYKIISYGDTKVAYVGISDPQTTSKSGASFKNSDGSAAYAFLDGNEGKDLYNRIQAAVDDAKKEGADYVVALGHLSSTGTGAYTAKSVIENTSGINAFINGGTHEAVDGDKVKAKDGKYVLLTSPGANMKNIGVLTISAGKSISSQLLMSSYRLRDIKTKDGIDALSKKYHSALSESFATSGCRLEAASTSGVRIVESQETNLGDLCADAYRITTGSDIAFVEASEIKSDIPIGSISYGDIAAALPGNQNISVIQVDGYTLMDALEMAVRLYPNRNKGFLQVSGLTFDIQETVIPSVKTDNSGNFVSVDDDYRVTNIMIRGKELDLMGTYTVAGTNDFLNGETGYSMFAECALKAANVTTDNQALISYISTTLGGKIGAAYSKAQNRIDSIKIARQSEINAEIEKKTEEKIKDYVSELESLRKQVQLQADILDLKDLTIKASSVFSKKGSKRSIKVSWKPSKEISGLKYQLYKSTKKGSGYKKLTTTSKKMCTNTSSLTKGKTYYYKVRGYKYLNNKYYYSGWSNVTYKKVS